MRTSERKELVESLVHTAKAFQKAMLRYKQKDLGAVLISETRGLRNGILFAARQVYGRESQAYFRNRMRRAA